MKYEIKEISEVKKKLQSLTSEEFDVYYAEALREFTKEAELPGFRKGKVPEKIIEEKISQADLLSEAADHAIRDRWIKILNETKLEAISQPHVEIVKVAKGNPFIFNVEVESFAGYKVAGYKGGDEGDKERRGQGGR